ncbi:MAG: FHA domain-containing protein [Actinobacteria bacterium]|nr:FHA domain-containing protein [Actinomycetota bacterium]
MQLKFTLQSARPQSSGPQSSGAVSRDLVVTIDSSATVGDLATYLVRADPQRSALAALDDGELTLALVDQNYRVVDARLTVPESGLRSGVTVAVTRRSESVVDVGRPVAVARIVAGPDSGKELPLWRGTAYIGRGHGAEIQVSDSSVSRRHAKLVVAGLPAVADAVEVVDLGSANGISVGGAEVPRAVLKAGDRVRLGDTEVEVLLLDTDTSALSCYSRDSASVAFSRSPRIAPLFEGREFDLPDLPERPKPSRMPWLAMMLPALMGMGIFAFTHSPYSLMFVLMSPMMMLGNYVEQRRGGKKDFENLMRDFREDLEIVATRIRESLVVEAGQRCRENPSSVECAQTARQLSPLLWTRRGDTPGFLELRLGRATLPSRSSMTMPAVGRSTALAWSELASSVEGLSVVPDVPVVVDPLSTGAIGVSGVRGVALPAARSLVLQAVSLHSPAELIVTAVASTNTARDWDWLKWVPHTALAHSPISAGHLASTAPACSALLSELEDLIAPAGGPHQTQEDQDPSHPRVLLLVENDAPAERARLVQLAEKGWRNGICVLWLAPTTPLLPAACRVFLEVEGSAGGAGYVKEGHLVTPVVVDTVSLEQTLAAARSLAPVEDSGAPVDDDSDLPRAVSLLTLTGTELARSEDAVIERWGESRSILTGPFAPQTPYRKPGNLRAIVGQSAQGTFSVDLRADGPHALVGGTTGAGKSELLQAWILGMASAHSPQRVTFLLVDYKGGSAFRDCVELPHTVGLVTDLSPHLVRRALASLSAELRHREHLLAQYRAKDLVELERRGQVDAPPSLVIIVDEFAALVQEVPGFVEGVVNVAQRGRSLGVHLILATQRPAGVIKDNLRANTNLRLALRMADENDSADVLGSTVAASFDLDLPGRAVSKSGPGRLTPFQTGYAGGWTSDTPPPPEMRVETLNYGLGQVWELPVDEADLDEADHDKAGPTDIQRLVSTIGVAAKTAELPTPRVPWLPELRPVYDLARMSTARSDDQLVFGVADDPDNQAQPEVAFDPDREGNLAVYGASGSGKSVFLRTIALAAGLTGQEGPCHGCHVYGIDFGNRALSMLESLPHVGSIVPGDDHERLTRLLLFLRETIDDRAVRYSRASAATITDYRRLANAPDESRIIVLVDGLTAFRAAYEMGGKARWLDLFTSLAADGRPVGVHFVISVDQRAGMPSSLASAVQRRVVLRMAHPDDYSFLGVAGDVLSLASPPGRGLLNGAEIQCAVLGGTCEVMGQSRAVGAFGEAGRKSGMRQAPPIRSLTNRVLMSELPSEVEGRPVLGVGSTSLSALPFEPRGSFVVTGPSGSGRTSSLASLARSLRRWDSAMTLYLVTPRRSSELAVLSDWTEVAAGTDAIVALTTRLQGGLLGGAHQGQMAVVVERMDDLAGTAAEHPLSGLVKACLDHDRFVVAEGETMFFSSGFGLPGLLKTSRSGLALQPDGVEGQSVFRSSFPAFNRADQPEGRGFLVQRGRPEMLQVALPG